MASVLYCLMILFTALLHNVCSCCLSFFPVYSANSNNLYKYFKQFGDGKRSLFWFFWSNFVTWALTVLFVIFLSLQYLMLVMNILMYSQCICFYSRNFLEYEIKSVHGPLESRKKEGIVNLNTLNYFVKFICTKKNIDFLRIKERHTYASLSKCFQTSHTKIE